MQYATESPETFYGAWMLSKYDPDRQVQQVAHSTWEQIIAFQLSQHNSNLDEFKSSEFVRGLLSFAVQAIMRPESIYRTFYPSAPSSVQPHDHMGGKDRPRKSGETSSATHDKQKEAQTDKHRGVDGEEENQSDREGRIRTSALGALTWLIGQLLFRIVFSHHILTMFVYTYAFNRIELYLIKSQQFDR